MATMQEHLLHVEFLEHAAGVGLIFATNIPPPPFPFLPTWACTNSNLATRIYIVVSYIRNPRAPGNMNVYSYETQATTDSITIINVL